jgi:serine/threonine protein kinase
MKEKLATESRRLSEEEVLYIMRQILLALNYLHNKGFIHRDLKPENFVINKDTMDVKMIDFGTVKDIGKNNPPFTTYVSTRWYRAPEMVLRSHNYGTPSVIFAAGCIMAELFYGVALFPGGSEYDQLETIFKILGTPKIGQWKEGYKLAQTKGIKLEEM